MILLIKNVVSTYGIHDLIPNCELMSIFYNYTKIFSCSKKKKINYKNIELVTQYLLFLLDALNKIPTYL